MPLSKSKLTLWVPYDTKEYSKQWAKRHRESVSQLFSEFVMRLKRMEKTPMEPTPIVARLTGVLRGQKVSRQDYRRHLEEKHLK